VRGISQVAIAAQHLQTVTWWNAQIIQRTCRRNHLPFAQRGPRDTRKPFAYQRLEQHRRLLAVE